MQAALLKELAGGFVTNRMAVARAIREMREKDPEGFAGAALEVLRDTPENPGPRFLLALLLAQPNGLALICDPECFSPEQSISLVQQAKTLDAQVEVKLAKILLAAPVQTDQQANLATRILDILDHSADPMTILPALRQLLQCPNPRVRSKAALLIGRISRNPQWAKLADPLQDQRVVANAIESLWGLDSAAAKSAFREAANDSRNRVAGNAALGLYVAGDPHGITALFRLSRNKEASFRATAAWSMGYAGDPRFLPRLAELARDPDDMVSRAASKAGTAIADRCVKLKEQPPVQLHIRVARWHEEEHEVQVSVGDGSAGGLRPLQFILWCGDSIVEDFSFAEIHNGAQIYYQLKWCGPIPATRQVKVQLVTSEGVGSDSGIELPI